MSSGRNVHGRETDISTGTPSRLRRCEGMAEEMAGRMSYWRWLLFALMARFEAGQDVYLRLPNARVIRGEVPVTMQPER